MLMQRTINAHLIQSDHIGVLDKLHKSHLLQKEHVDNVITQLISISVQPKKINLIIYWSDNSMKKKKRASQKSP